MPHLVDQEHTVKWGRKYIPGTQRNCTLTSKNNICKSFTDTSCGGSGWQITKNTERINTAWDCSIEDEVKWYWDMNGALMYSGAGAANTLCEASNMRGSEEMLIMWTNIWAHEGGKNRVQPASKRPSWWHVKATASRSDSAHCWRTHCYGTNEKPHDRVASVADRSCEMLRDE